MAGEKKSAEANVPVITIPGTMMFPSPRNDKVTIISILDSEADNGFRSFGVETFPCVKQRESVPGQPQLYDIHLTRSDDYGTSIKKNGTYERKYMSASQIVEAWEAQKELNMSGPKAQKAPAQQQQQKTVEKAATESKPVVASADDTKPKWLRGISGDDLETVMQGDKIARYKLKIPDSASASGYGLLHILPDQLKADLNVAGTKSVCLGMPGKPMSYYQRMNEQGKWKICDPVLKVADVEALWSAAASAKLQQRTAKIAAKADDMAVQSEAEREALDQFLYGADDEAFG